jgi:molybdenum cofactor cytidylyltransferase
MHSAVRTFAIIPAAGRSRRMGQAKLLLPWGKAAVIDAVLHAWRASRVSQVIVVVHPADAELADRCRAAGATVISPDVPPPEMKVSVQIGLRYVVEKHHPTPDDAWLLAPADMPLIKASTIDQLIDAHEQASRTTQVDRSWTRGLSGRPIIVPVTELAGQDPPSNARRRGHPVLFPWPLAAAVDALPPDAGINRLLQQHDVLELPVPGLVLDDLDTPAEYERLRESLESPGN